ncbi:hypothetical protein, partial [Streptomyces sp. NPDC004976]
MNQYAHPAPPNGSAAPTSTEIVLPHDLKGPFLREYVPEVRYRHTGLQHTSVVHYRNGGHSIITAQDAEHVNRPWPWFLRRPSSVCLIARGRHQASFGMQLPSRGDQDSFACAVDVQWEVHDFALAAEMRVVDVEKMLRAPLLARLRVVTRRYGLDAAQDADEAIQRELETGRWEPFGVDLGLTTVVYVRVDLGQAAADHQKAILSVRHSALTQSAQDRADAARVQANLSTARELIAAGEADQYAYLVAQDPGRADEILRELQAQARDQRQGALEYLSRLIEQGVVQRHQVEGQVQRLIDFARSTGDTLFDSRLPQPPTVLPVTAGEDEPVPLSWGPAASTVPSQPPAPPASPSRTPLPHPPQPPGP